jgi:hypothetical protein
VIVVGGGSPDDGAGVAVVVVGMGVGVAGWLLLFSRPVSPFRLLYRFALVGAAVAGFGAIGVAETTDCFAVPPGSCGADVDMRCVSA